VIVNHHFINQSTVTESTNDDERFEMEVKCGPVTPLERGVGAVRIGGPTQ